MNQDISLPKITSRAINFLYVERVVISRRDFALTMQNSEGTIEIPITSLTTLLLGPGTSITDKAVTLINDNGVTLIWVGEGGVRYYASGTPLAKSARVIIRQAELVSVKTSRLRVAKNMYQMRFPDENISGLTLQQLRGREGTRVKNTYRDTAKKYGTDWSKRISQMEKIQEYDQLNQAITMSTACLYGVCHAIIVAIGASPALGFVHNGNARSFVFDIADLYKTEIAIPVAFEIVTNPDLEQTIDYSIRSRMREVIHQQKLMRRIVDDIKTLLGLTDENWDSDELQLFDSELGTVEAHKNWSET